MTADSPQINDADDAAPDRGSAPDTAEKPRKLFAAPCQFIAGANSIASLPPMTLPEIAFAGRSNVGKSSLINAVVGRRTLARTSQTPGRTRQLNFFDLGGKCHLVDLPGYGFAKAPKGDIRAWTALTADYLKGRASLKRVFLLIDARRGIGASDREIMAMFDASAVSWALVLTKADTLAPDNLTQTAQSCTIEAATHTAAWPGILVTSAAKKIGIETVQGHIAKLAQK